MCVYSILINRQFIFQQCVFEDESSYVTRHFKVVVVAPAQLQQSICYMFLLIITTGFR